MVSDVQAFSTTDGYTFFVAGKNTGTKSANGTFSNPTTFSLHNNISTNTYNGRAVTFTPESFTDYLATGTSVGFTYSTSLNGSSSRLRDMSPYTTIGVSFDYMNIPFTTFSASTSLSNGKMRYSSSSVPPLTYSGKTWNKFTLNGTSLTTESPSSINYEYYEILFYNKTLTQSQVNEVVNYLNTKWLIPSFDFSGMAIINVDNFIGKTGGTANNLNITEPNASSQGLWSSIFGDTDNNILASGLTRFQTTSVSPVGYDWVLLDSNNNIVRDEICQDTSDGYADITLSAGTYTLSGETKYTCIIPSPTPTQTPTPTPTPMYFPTTIYINYTGDTNSYLYGRDDFGNTGFTINGAVTTAFTWTDFVVTNQNNALGIYNSAGAKMSFNRYYADCSTGAPTSSLVDSRTCISEEYGWTNDLGGTPLGYCEVFDIWFDNSCP
jgi:hypothetical protein